MDKEVVVIKPAELILKSKGVRTEFEKRLFFNIKDCLKKKSLEFDYLIKGQGRYFIYTPEPDDVILAIKSVFGISNLYSAIQVGAEIRAIKFAFCDLADELNIGPKHRFGIRVSTASTSFPMSAREVEKEVGATIQRKTRAKVNLSCPDYWLRAEIVGKRVFIYSKIIQGFGGLPLGTGGKVIVFMSEKRKDIVAAWLMMRRGCEIIPIHFRSNEKILSKFQKNCKALQKFAWGSKIKPMSIKRDRRIIKKEVAAVVERTGARAYVFGNTEFHRREADLPVFEPLIGLSQRRINSFLSQIINNSA